jgi:hypothetical protein
MGNTKERKHTPGYWLHRFCDHNVQRWPYGELDEAINEIYWHLFYEQPDGRHVQFEEISTESQEKLTLAFEKLEKEILYLVLQGAVGGAR